MKHKDINKLLETLNMDEKDLKTVKNIYWQQTVAIKINNHLRTFRCIKKGVGQGCVLGPMFLLYSEQIKDSKKYARDCS